MSIRERERFKKIFTVATNIATELKLDYYTSDPKRLTLQEALFLIAAKKKLPEVAIPSALASFPWKISKNGTEKENLPEEKRNKINMIFEQSMKVQMGTIPETEFSQCILSNACLAVSGLLHVYLSNLDIRSDLGRYLFKIFLLAKASKIVEQIIFLQP